jgi:hypothetical protein
MHSSRLRHLTLAGLAMLLFAAALAPAVQALPAPSKTAPDQTLAERESDLATVASVLDQEEVVAALAAHGFTREEANLRLAQLAPEELGALANQVEQLQSAGQWPWWIWLVVAGVIVVAIISIA